MSRFSKIVKAKLKEELTINPLVQELNTMHEKIDQMQETIIEKYSSANFDRENHRAEYYNEVTSALSDARLAISRASDYLNALTEDEVF
jgi:UDP-N-acetylglucosamine:LPS N-acetylglucosamine transferase